VEDKQTEVSIDNFGELLNWFGPMDADFLEKVKKGGKSGVIRRSNNCTSWSVFMGSCPLEMRSRLCNLWGRKLVFK
jgi:hypothetical protein